MKSIRDVLVKIKSIDKGTLADLYVVVLILLVGFSSFGLGRLSVLDIGKESVQIIGAVVGATQLEDDTTTPPSISGGTIVGSKNGSKYHYPWCSGAVRIKEENKVWFASVEEARKVGYTPAANCKGLN